MPTINRGDDYFQAITYTGNGSTQTISGLRFQPDFVWIKGRSGATDHALYDAQRGVQKRLESNTTDAEATSDNGVTAFTSDGFTLGSLAQVNTNGATYVAWAWNAGGSTVTNTSGTISAQVRANPTAGFSVVTWTSTGANATVGHGLGVAPKMVIVKGRSAVSQWFTWHTSLTSGAYALILNLTDAQASYPTVFNSTTPTSNVFSVGTSLTNGTTAVAYCWAEVAGYSAFGKYTGNGSADGPFVYTGFRPRFLMVKNSSAVGNWLMFDSSRDTYNQEVLFFFANTSDAEQNSSGTVSFDFLSNGFKVRNTSGNINGSGNTLIYMAFAENPFKNSLAR
jgi:hypothetical protein